MSFRSLDFSHLATFNSAVASEVLSKCEDGWSNSIANNCTSISSRYIAPSGIRCQRAQWFRLRGTTPDKVSNPDVGLDFTAKIGTACHRILQTILRDELGDKWISLSEYLSCVDIGHQYKCKEVDDGLETQVEFLDIPIRFACDGVLKLNEKFYLLEIKSNEFSSFNNLTDVKPQHIPQIQCYSALLNLPDVIVMYIDRQYGSLKCYEKNFSAGDMAEVYSRIDSIVAAVETNIAPDRLPTGDSWCSPSRCKYYKVCKQWG